MPEAIVKSFPFSEGYSRYYVSVYSLSSRLLFAHSSQYMSSDFVVKSTLVTRVK